MPDPPRALDELAALAAHSLDAELCVIVEFAPDAGVPVLRGCSHPTDRLAELVRQHRESVLLRPDRLDGAGTVCEVADAPHDHRTGGDPLATAVRWSAATAICDGAGAICLLSAAPRAAPLSAKDRQSLLMLGGLAAAKLPSAGVRPVGGALPPRALLPHESKLLALFGRDSVWCIYDERLAYSFISEGGMQKLLDARAVESAEELRKIVYGSTNAQLQQRLGERWGEPSDIERLEGGLRRAFEVGKSEDYHYLLGPQVYLTRSRRLDDGDGPYLLSESQPVSAEAFFQQVVNRHGTNNCAIDMSGAVWCAAPPLPTPPPCFSPRILPPPSPPFPHPPHLTPTKPHSTHAPPPPPPLNPPPAPRLAPAARARRGSARGFLRAAEDVSWWEGRKGGKRWEEEGRGEGGGLGHAVREREGGGG